MPSPKSGTAGTAVSPAGPKTAQDADNAVAGSVDQGQAGGASSKAMQLDSVQTKPFKPPQTKEEKKKKKSWIEIKLVDEEEKPIPGEIYQITLPDGQTVAEGTLDENGFARVEGFDPGNCEVAFPELDKDSWQEH